MINFISDKETIEWVYKYNHFLWELQLDYEAQGFPKEPILMFNIFKIVDELMK